MNSYIALLRGINVGGNRTLPMKELVAILEGLGAQGVRTYLQSGNALFRSDEQDPSDLAQRLAAAIGARRGFEPLVLILGRDALRKAMEENPFPEAEADPTHLHLGFLAARPANPDLAKLAGLKRESERFHLGDRVFYLHAPDGVGRSRLAASTERLLGEAMTDRNWKTVVRLGELAGE